MLLIPYPLACCWRVGLCFRAPGVRVAKALAAIYPFEAPGVEEIPAKFKDLLLSANPRVFELKEHPDAK